MHENALMPSPAGEITDLSNASGNALAVAEQGKIMAMISQAIARPRDMGQVAVALSHECRRPGFAARACYSLKIGGEHRRGPGIALYRAAATAYKNLRVRVYQLPSDDRHSHIRAEVYDMQNNIEFSHEARFLNRVRRGGNWLNLWEDGPNSGNFENDKRNLVRRVSGYVLRYALKECIPEDIIDAAFEEAQAVLYGKAAEDLEGKTRKETIRKLGVSFEEIQITTTMLQDYLGHPLDRMTAAELGDLRGIYKQIKAGEIDRFSVFPIEVKGGRATASDAAEQLEKEMREAAGGGLSDEDLARAEKAVANRKKATAQEGDAAPAKDALFEGADDETAYD